MLTQIQMYRQAEKRASDRHKIMLDLMLHPTNPMTKSDLIALIARKPERYQVYAGFLPQLKD
ncbi:hypothetical protein [Sinimarinibacterium sp. NLF-5-8]|uniref:hypothetical protein n=1 Tax=Sinimarinibacterium sp. NLF-5-8 TaxID=2698684 RepID=UPI00137BE938|nr:hypothetical protein [Sinimarinibacterium sp. NLF-5-8]QHS09011.1 hypothetical protein GT972_01870 [Sinimarinibacterium sp. NLF-5-8]